MNEMRSRITRALAAVAAPALLAVVVLPARGTAQEPDSRWLPWVGCWQPSGAGATAVAGDVIVCVTPQASGNGVEVRTVSNGETVGTRTLVADGQRHDFTDERCSGWQTASFSSDGQRVYLRSQMTCDGQVREASGIMAMASANEWLDAQSVGSGNDRAARVVRYAPATDARVRDAGLELPPRARMMAVADARLLAAADLDLDDVAEAAQHVDAAALEAFIVERRQEFNVDGNALVELADAGVPESVIDLIVAVSFPERFALDYEARDADVRLAEPRRAGDRYDDPFGWGRGSRYGYYSSCYGFGLGWGDWYGYDPFFFSPFGYRGCYDPFYYGRYAYGGYYRPIIIVDGDGDDGIERNARVVNGRGYTRGGSSAGGSRTRDGASVGSSPGRRAIPRATSGGYTRNPGSDAGTSTTSSGSGSGSSTSTGRTAKPRTGGGR